MTQSTLDTRRKLNVPVIVFKPHEETLVEPCLCDRRLRATDSTAVRTARFYACSELTDAQRSKSCSEKT